MLNPDLSYALYPGTFVDIVELLVPELQSRFVANGQIFKFAKLISFEKQAVYIGRNILPELTVTESMHEKVFMDLGRRS
jgi:hypothetical protein